MNGSIQGSLLDLTDEPAPGPLDKIRRTELSAGAWIDILPGWLTGADELFERLLHAVPWRAERRRMYERVVDVPRLLCFYDDGDTLPDL
ncbi:MAG TPA: alpha-ketoglutarate-dependent dioxygenase AlkB, partial [Streptosporangiaceae bacterium]